MRSTFAASSGTGWVGPLLEGIIGAATLLVGVVFIAGLGVSVGLGATVGNWVDLPALLLIWLPIVCLGVVGIGAVLNARGQATVLSRLRWLALIAFAVSTLGVLIVAPSGPIILVPYLLTFATAVIGELRARNGEAPASIGGMVSAGLATDAAAGIVALTLRGLAA